LISTFLAALFSAAILVKPSFQANYCPLVAVSFDSPENIVVSDR
jgi:hypothetical protein